MNINKHIPNITGDGFWWRNVVFRSPCLHEHLESSVFHYFEGPFTLWHPTDNFSPTRIQNEVGEKYQRWVWVSYLASVEVCWQCEKFTFPFMICSNWAVMDLSCNLVFTYTKCALSRSRESSAAPTASPPQNFLACQRSPLVDLASAVSKNQQMSRPFFPLHFSAAHSNTWRQQPFTCSTRGSFLKKTYIGDVHSFDKCSNWLAISSVWYRNEIPTQFSLCTLFSHLKLSLIFIVVIN